MECANFALGRLGIPSKNPEEIKRTVGMTLQDTFYALTDIKEADISNDFVRLFACKADEVMTENTSLFPDTITTLTALQTKGYQTTIVTSKLRYRIEEVLKKYDACSLINYIVGFEDVKEPKPSPEGLKKAIHALSARREQVLYIGDNVIDAKTALNADVDFAAVTTGTTTTEDFQEYPKVLVAENLSQLLRVLAQ